MEIEAKYRVPDRRIFEVLLRLPSLGDVALIPSPGLEYQHNTYYDTPDRRLTAQRASLRIRESGGTRVATLKYSRGGSGAIHIRDEWEATIGAEPHPSAWPDSSTRAQALHIVAGAPLVALFTIQNRRYRIGLVRNSAVIGELSLDEGHIQAGGRILGFRELEIELSHDGAPDDLVRLGALLAHCFGLSPEPRGKRSRGVALLRELTAEAEQSDSSTAQHLMRVVGLPQATAAHCR